MQPTLRHVPPNFPRDSIHAVWSPSCAALMAATYPPGPPPMTTTSYSVEAEAKARAVTDEGKASERCERGKNVRNISVGVGGSSARANGCGNGRNSVTSIRSIEFFVSTSNI
ncbi:hypothetical protein PsorP6_010428 [Peronosclerospora sorghi]|uniref:Uncharacterized protein n=1 Tax=Peronosclerospora sorghi TaxID=230839 RepID=A0ACC0VV83_9STRA|nr:hypothetical protein PsorP6_010428 [Peronosclerospora sorghi]